MTTPTTVPALKAPRAMHSQSPVFEAGYAAFMADVFARDVHSVRREETETTRALVLADMHRLVLDKKSGRLQMEKRARASAGQGNGVEAPWEAVRGFPVPSFWAGNAFIVGVIGDAWRCRVEQFIPAPDLCYPDGVPLRFKKDFPRAEKLCSMMVGLATDRRMGGRVNQRAASRAMVSGMWNFLVDREMLRLCQAYFGRKASLVDYNFTVRRQAELVARAAETPNLTPLIGTYLLSHPDLKSGKRVLPKDVLAAAKKTLFSVDEPERKASFGREPAEKAPREPLSPAGWRYLAGATRVGIEHIWRTAVTSSESAARMSPVLNLLAKTGDAHPLAFIRWALGASLALGGVSRPEASDDLARESLLRFLRVAGRQAALAKKKGQLKRFVSGELTLCWDWFRNHENRRGGAKLANVVSVPKNATWASVMRAQHEWHAARAERERVRREADRVAYAKHLALQDAKDWESTVGACEIEGVAVTPLKTGKALREEGTQMTHCVGDYVDACEAGGSRIFHLALADEQATLELKTEGRREWRVSQVFGPKNKTVSPALAAVANALAKRYQIAEAQLAAAARPARALQAA